MNSRKKKSVSEEFAYKLMTYIFRNNNRKEYLSDTRYAKVLEQMDLLRNNGYHYNKTRQKWYNNVEITNQKYLE